MRNETPNKIGIIARHSTAAALAFIGISGSVQLKLSNIIDGDLPFISLISLSVLVGLIISFHDRVEIVNLLKLEFKIRQIEEARKDVIAREENIQKIAKILGEIAVFSSVMNGLRFPRDAVKLRNKWYENKVKQLMDITAMSSKDRQKVFITRSLYENIYPEGSYDKETISNGWSKFWEHIKAEIK